jgi:hypothetical protein
MQCSKCVCGSNLQPREVAQRQVSTKLILYCTGLSTSHPYDSSVQAEFICANSGCFKDLCNDCYFGSWKRALDQAKDDGKDLYSCDAFDMATLAQLYSKYLYKQYPIDSVRKEWQFQRSNFLALYDATEKEPELNKVTEGLMNFGKTIVAGVSKAVEIVTTKEKGEIVLYTMEEPTIIDNDSSSSFYKRLNFLLL